MYIIFGMINSQILNDDHIGVDGEQGVNIQSTLATTDLVITETLLYRTHSPANLTLL